MRIVDQSRQMPHDLAGAEHHRREHHQVGSRRGHLLPRHDLQLDAVLLAVHAQDEIDRVELAVARRDARLARQCIEHRAQALAGARLRDDAVGAWRVDQLRGEAAEHIAALEPQLPRAIQIPVPRVERTPHVLRHPVGRAAERMVGEIDLLPCQHARKARPDVLLQPGFIQDGCGHRSARETARRRATCAGTRRRRCRRCRA